ncbi:MAG TPA: hypothetical protein VIL92_06130 [Gaiellaceae bacterium]
MSRTRNCTKKRYDRLGAEIALADAVRKSKRNSQQAQLREESRIYRCAICAGHHLTSEPLRAKDEAAA